MRVGLEANNIFLPIAGRVRCASNSKLRVYGASKNKDGQFDLSLASNDLRFYMISADYVNT